MKYLLPLILVSLFIISCGGSSPTGTGNNGNNGNNGTGGGSPMILAVIDGSVFDLGSGPVTGFSLAEAQIWASQAVSTATVLVSYNSNSVTLPFMTSSSLGSTVLSAYILASPAITYVPGATYTMSVSGTIGNYSSTMTAPGGIAWSGSITTTLTATAVDAGTYDSANVMRTYPTPGTTYVSGTSSVGNAFSFPASAFSSPSTPATFTATYSAAATQYSFTGGSVLTGSAFTWLETYSKTFNK